MHILDSLKERGLIAQTTFEEELYEQLEREPTTFYVGFDPTAPSLHFGHFIPVIAMRHMQQAGHIPIALMGGGTVQVADPTGKTELRQMLSLETIAYNAEKIRQQLSRFICFDDEKALMVNNADWLVPLQYLPFLREIGPLFSVNRMLTAEAYRLRMEKGLTFLEFNYMIMQAYDFLELFRRYGCRLQMGGDDQWSNILAGADLIRRKEQTDAFALTCKLIMTHDGKKMGKTEAGALWLDAARTSPYEFYQYWRNVGDPDVERFLGLLTFLPMEEVRRLGSLPDAGINEAKRVLAYEVTKLVHGEEEAQKAQDAAQALFGGGGQGAGVPSYEVTRAQLIEDGRVTTLLALCGLCASRGEARKMVQAGAVMAGEEKVTDIEATISEEMIGSEGLLLRKGKKNYCRLVLK